MTKVIIIGDYDPDYPPHPATTESLKHAMEKTKLDLNIEWLDSGRLREPYGQLFSSAGAIWLGPAPYKNKEGVRKVLTFIRENDIPFLGTCGGMYQAISEFFTTKLGYSENLVELSPGDKRDSLFLRDTDCSVHGFKIVKFKTVENTIARSIYPTIVCEEDSNCGFAVNLKYHSIFAENNFIISGTDEQSEAKILELKSNKFYVVTKFLPQIRSKPGMPHPLVEAFVKAGMN
jgi:CTP synthase (UTP-ammonia lyase)